MKKKIQHALAKLRSKIPPLPPKVARKLKPVHRFFAARWAWYKKLSKPKKFALIGGPIITVMIAIPLGTYIYFASAISDPEQLLNYNNTGVVLLDSDGEAFYSFGTADRGDRLSLDQISDFTEQAVISAEDRNFYEHGGFSVLSILGALFANVSSGDFTAYGGSTLTQQLAKNTVLYDDQTIIRKYQELAIAVAIEQQYTKDEILDLYLNSVYYGEGAFGIGSAAETYFGKSAADLTLAESAMLIGVLPAPSAYSPISGNPEFAKERQETVLSRMVDNGVITQEEADQALAVELAYAEQDSATGSAPHFAEMVLNDLYEEYGEDAVVRSGYSVTTTLDSDIQEAANASVAAQRSFINANGGSNAAVVAIDPASGAVRAMVGSVDYSEPDFGTVNMANTPRQPGSSIKPLYYTEAMQRGIITPATILEDQPTNFGGYRPENADRGYRGDITVRNALSQSLNIPSVEVMQRLGLSNAIDALQRLGLDEITTDGDYGLSLALGTAEVTLTDMTNAFATLANSGDKHDVQLYTRIVDKFDKEVFQAPVQESSEAMGEAASFLISDILNDESARAPIFGSTLNTPGYDVAVKTGTTENARDAWTIGYAKQLAVGVWVGNNDNSPMSFGGSTMAGPIWQRTILAGLAGQANQPFTAPSSVERLRVCRDNGLRAVGGGTEGTYLEYFIRGAVPSGTCEVLPEPVDSDDDGVPDDKDACADTPPGLEVDATGCVVEEEEEIIDTDGDGVPDEIDECAETPEDALVDDVGCEAELPQQPAEETNPPTSQNQGSNGLVRRIL